MKETFLSFRNLFFSLTLHQALRHHSVFILNMFLITWILGIIRELSDEFLVIAIVLYFTGEESCERLET